MVSWWLGVGVVGVLGGCGELVLVVCGVVSEEG